MSRCRVARNADAADQNAPAGVIHFDRLAQVGPDLVKSYQNAQLLRDRGRIPGREGG